LANDVLKQHAQAALTRHQAFKQTPELTQQRRVESATIGGPLADKILGRVKSIKNWFGS
jgi:hypothetical protein